jgi:hypothetical protein
MKITVKDKEIELKQTFRSLIMYENLTEKAFEPKTFQDILVFLYCIVLTSSKDYSLITFDEFIDFIDEHHQVLADMTKWLSDQFAGN